MKRSQEKKFLTTDQYNGLMDFKDSYDASYPDFIGELDDELRELVEDVKDRRRDLFDAIDDLEMAIMERDPDLGSNGEEDE